MEVIWLNQVIYFRSVIFLAFRMDKTQYKPDSRDTTLLMHYKIWDINEQSCSNLHVTTGIWFWSTADKLSTENP